MPGARKVISLFIVGGVSAYLVRRKLSRFIHSLKD